MFLQFRRQRTNSISWIKITTPKKACTCTLSKFQTLIRGLMPCSSSCAMKTQHYYQWPKYFDFFFSKILWTNVQKSHPYGDEEIVLFYLVQVWHSDLVCLEHIEAQLFVDQVHITFMVPHNQLAPPTYTGRDVHIL